MVYCCNSSDRLRHLLFTNMNAVPFSFSLPDESDPEKICVLLPDLKRINDVIFERYSEPGNMVDIGLE